MGRSPGERNYNPHQYLAWEIPWTEAPGRLQSIESQSVKHNLATKNNNKEFSCLCRAHQSPLQVSCRRPKREGSGHSQLNTGSPPSAAPTCVALGLSPSHHPRWQSQIQLADTRSTPGQRGEPNNWKELLQEGGSLPGPKTGLLSNTQK